jgi:uncharacterized phage-associated protein
LFYYDGCEASRLYHAPYGLNRVRARRGAELRDRLPGLGDTKLHKLLYYCQGIHLAHAGRPLFDETISAWDRGPVVGTLWKHEHDADNAPTRSRAELTNEQLGTISYVVSTYGKLSGGDLSRLTHSEDPWKRGDTERQQRGVPSARIRVEWIADYFQSADREADEDDDQINAEAVQQWLTEVAQTPAPRPGEPATRQSLVTWARRVA